MVIEYAANGSPIVKETDSKIVRASSSVLPVILICESCSLEVIEVQIEEEDNDDNDNNKMIRNEK